MNRRGTVVEIGGDAPSIVGRGWWRRGLVFGWLMLVFLSADGRAREATASGDKVLGTLIDFASEAVGPYQGGYIDYWRWSDEQRRRAGSLSRLDIVVDPESGRKMLRVQVLDP